MTIVSQILIVCNVVYAVVSVFFVYRMLKASSVYNWNPGDGDLQGKQKIKILTSIVTIAAIGLIAAITNLVFV